MKDISPILEDIANKYNGINKERIEVDITSKLKTASASDITVLEKLSFKEAKKEFRKIYITRILVLFHGNISKTAETLAISRRTLHRNIKDFKIDVNSIKTRMEKTYFLKKEALNHMLDSLVKSYDNKKEEISEDVYSDLDQVAEILADNISFEVLTLKRAEKLFEKKYYSGILKTTKSIKDAALRSNTNYEKLTQKIKKMKLEKDFLI